MTRAPSPTLVFVAGFLGSGKTTAIVGLCRLLSARGVRTAVVTNDQGRRQVDLAFARAAGVPAVAVADGCLCCHYDDFEERVRELAESDRPEIVFAESVGSCADLVATVIRPFEAFRERHGAAAGHLSTFADVRLLEAYLSGRGLPFSEHVSYIFESQLEEADCIVVNKRDRLDPGRAERVLEAARARWPGARQLLTNAFDERDLLAWYALVEPAGAAAAPPRRARVEVDYARYAAGELEMAWLDLAVELRGAAGTDLGPAVVALVEDLALRVRAAGLTIGHLKAHARGDAGEAKLGIATADLAADRSRLPRPGATVDLLLNLRAVADPQELAACAAAGLREVAVAHGVEVRVIEQSVFRPGVPRPRHRMTDDD